jgi:hypothetical protein
MYFGEIYVPVDTIGQVVPMEIDLVWAVTNIRKKHS